MPVIMCWFSGGGNVGGARNRASWNGRNVNVEQVSNFETQIQGRNGKTQFSLIDV